MNWLGKVIQKKIGPRDTVLDLGCGIMQATTDSLGKLRSPGNLICKSIVGVDVYPKYISRIKDRYNTIKAEVSNTNLFIDKSYDIVICLDVLEHLEKDQAMRMLDEMSRIARKRVIAYTPKEFHNNEEHVHESWDMGSNKYQEHHSLISQDEFRSKGFEVTTTEIDHNTLAIKYFGKRELSIREYTSLVIRKIFQRVNNIIYRLLCILQIKSDAGNMHNEMSGQENVVTEHGNKKNPHG